MSPAVPDRSIDVDVPAVGLRLRATRWLGSGDGSPALLLLHGLAAQRHYWRPVMSRLPHLSAVALDQRGHGESDKPDDAPYDVVTCANDAATALDALGLDRVVVVGHSWGASVAEAFAVHHPDRTLALVAIDGGLVPSEYLGDRAELRRRLEPPRWAADPEDLRARFGSRFPAVHRAEAAAALWPNVQVGPDGLARARLPFELHMRVLDGMLDHSPLDALAQVTVPTWVVVCESGEGMPGEPRERAAAALRERRPDARLMRWVGAVHDVPLQWPALVSGLLRAAVEEVAPVAGGTDSQASSPGGATE
ncbi:MAG: alpha/beta fold hydrolase [Actinomycetes bacterium]